MFTISELYIYPIKSLGGISVATATVTDRGFQYDRRWMLVDGNNRFISQRTVAALALFSVKIIDSGLMVTYDTASTSINIPFKNKNTETGIATIWDDDCHVEFVDSGIDAWFSDILSIPCRLVYMPDATRRIVEEPFSQKNNITSLSDAYPLLITGQSSLDDLNSRLQAPIPMDRFRTNIVFTGGEPFIEDSFENFTINSVAFCGVKPCDRCVVTTIDQGTTLRSTEPLKTLATYRKWNNKVYFGQNVLIRRTGTVSVGQELIVAEYSVTPPL